MTSRAQYYIGTVSIILLVLIISSTACAIELKTAAQNSGPKYYVMDNGDMGGICVDILLAVEAIDSRIKFSGYQEFLPFVRLQNYLEAGQLDVFFGFKKTDIRKEKFIFSDTPLYELNYVVAVLSDDPIEIKNFKTVRSLSQKGKLLTVNGTAASRFLKKEGVILYEDGAKSTINLIRMLISKRGRFAFYHDLGLNYTIKSEHLEDKVKVLPASFATYYHYAAFAKSAPRETIDSVTSALKRLQDTGELSQIYNNYLHSNTSR